MPTRGKVATKMGIIGLYNFRDALTVFVGLKHIFFSVFKTFNFSPRLLIFHKPFCQYLGTFLYNKAERKTTVYVWYFFKCRNMIKKEGKIPPENTILNH